MAAHTPRPSVQRKLDAEAQADRVAAYIRAGLIVCAVIITVIVTNSPGYEAAIEAIGRI